MKEIRDKEVKDRLLERYIKNLAMAKELIDSLVPVIWQFDHKVYNKRFDNAIKTKLEERKEQTEGKPVFCSVDLDCKRIYIKLEFYQHRSISEPNNYVYLPNGYEEVNICYHWTDYSMWDSERNKKYYYADNGEYFYIDNGNIRLNANKLVDLMLEKQKEITEKIDTLMKAKETVVEVYNKVEDLKAELSTTHDSTPRIIDTIYGIKTYGSFTSQVENQREFIVLNNFEEVKI